MKKLKVKSGWFGSLAKETASKPYIVSDDAIKALKNINKELVQPVNLTEAMTKACADLRSMKKFNGVRVLTATCTSAQEFRKDWQEDMRHTDPSDPDYKTPHQIEEFIRDYAIITLEFDFDELTCDLPDSDYISSEFDIYQFEKDFRKWVLRYVGNDESVLPKEFLFEHCDNELIRGDNG